MSCVNYEGDNVTITKTEYDALMADSKVLSCLYASGVDNWEWYGAAMEMLEEEEE